MRTPAEPRVSKVQDAGAHAPIPGGGEDGIALTEDDIHLTR
jgi:hypothetical protein